MSTTGTFYNGYVCRSGMGLIGRQLPAAIQHLFSAFREHISGCLRPHSPCWHRKCPVWHIPAADRAEWRPGGSCLRTQLHARGRGRVGGQGTSVKAAEDGNLSPCCAAGKVHLAQCLHLWEEASEHKRLQASSMQPVFLLITIINLSILHLCKLESHNYIACFVCQNLSNTLSQFWTVSEFNRHLL